jgi:hypothetical protein
VLDASGMELHSAGWTFDADAGVLSFDVRSGAGIPTPRPDDRLELEVEFSEPMAAASLWIEPELGSLSLLASQQEVDRRKLWRARLKLERIPRAPARVLISGQDLAGTTLFPFVGPAPLDAPFAKRTSADPLVDATRDALHVVPFAAHVGASRLR